jgi:hypothetical protein
VLLTKYYLGDQIKKNEVGRACAICGRQERCTQNFGGSSEKKEGPLGKPRHRWGIVLTWTFKKCDGRGDIDLFDQTQDRDRWQAVVNVVMNLQVPLLVVNF